MPDQISGSGTAFSLLESQCFMDKIGSKFFSFLNKITICAKKYSFNGNSFSVVNKMKKGEKISSIFLLFSKQLLFDQSFCVKGDYFFPPLTKAEMKVLNKNLLMLTRLTSPFEVTKSHAIFFRASTCTQWLDTHRS